MASNKSDHLKVLDDLRHRLKAIPLPAFVNDVFGDIVLANTCICKLLEGPDATLTQPPNMLTKNNLTTAVFSPESPFRSLLGEQWLQIAHLNMQFFRGISLRYRLHSHFQRLLPELLKFPAFKRYWEQAHLEETDISPDSIEYAYHHPMFGPLAYVANISMSVTRLGELYTVVYLPMDQLTRKVFHGIIEEYGNDVVQPAPWPKEGSAAPSV